MRGVGGKGDLVAADKTGGRSSDGDFAFFAAAAVLGCSRLQRVSARQRGRGSAMTSTNNLQKLADQLEQSARSGRGAQLSRHATELLLAVIRASAETDGTVRQVPAPCAFRIIAGDGWFEEVVARSSDYAIAKAMFDEAVRQSPHLDIRLVKDFEVLEQTRPCNARSKWPPKGEIERSIFGA
jgi:hypothetical protein